MFDWILQNMWALWLAAVLILAVIEMLTLDLFFVMLSGGAVSAMIASLIFPDNLVVQILTFSVVSLLLIVAVRPTALRHLKARQPHERMGIESLLGEPAVILESVSSDAGIVKIGGDTWTARTTEGVALEVGDDAIVERIDGATAIIVPATAAQTRKHTRTV